jgi:acyl dehydratase
VTVTLDFDALPSPSLWPALLRWPGRRATTTTIPRIEARAHVTTGDIARVAEPSAYAAVCGFAPGAPLPATWPHVLAAPLHLAMFGHAAFPLPSVGMVHVRQRIVQRRVLHADAPLRIEAVVEGHRRVRHGGEIDLVTRVLVGDDVPWEGTTTILSRALQGDTAATREPATQPEGLTDTVAIDVPADTGRRYAALSGDVNPIHTNLLAARLFGFPRPIAHGMWSLARILAALGPKVPAACVIDARFLSPVLLPSALELRTGTSNDGVTHAVLHATRPCVVASVAPLPEIPPSA